MEQIHNVDDKLHAFLSLNEKAVDQAREIDKKIKSGEKLDNALACRFPLKITFASKTPKQHVRQRCLKILLHHMMLL